MKWGYIGEKFGAPERIRTSNPLREHGPKPCAYTNSATGALKRGGFAISAHIYMHRVIIPQFSKMWYTVYIREIIPVENLGTPNEEYL